MVQNLEKLFVGTLRNYNNEINRLNRDINDYKNRLDEIKSNPYGRDVKKKKYLINVFENKLKMLKKNRMK